MIDYLKAGDNFQMNVHSHALQGIRQEMTDSGCKYYFKQAFKPMTK